MSLPNDEVLQLLSDNFVLGHKNIHKEEHVGMSHGYTCKQTAVGTTNGAGGRNVQLVVMASDLTVLHVLPGFWHPDDLIRELNFARQLHRLYRDDAMDDEQKQRFAEVLRASHTRGFSDDTIARSDWQGFDRREELNRYRKGPRDTVVLDSFGRPALKPVCQVVHDRMADSIAEHGFQRYDARKKKSDDPRFFDLATFVDYGRPYYDNNAWIDRGHEFPAAKRANAKRQKAEAKRQKEMERASK